MILRVLRRTTFAHSKQRIKVLLFSCQEVNLVVAQQIERGRGGLLALCGVLTYAFKDFLSVDAFFNLAQESH